MQPLKPDWQGIGVEFVNRSELIKSAPDVDASGEGFGFYVGRLVVHAMQRVSTGH